MFLIRSLSLPEREFALHCPPRVTCRRPPWATTLCFWHRMQIPTSSPCSLLRPRITTTSHRIWKTRLSRLQRCLQVVSRIRLSLKHLPRRVSSTLSAVSPVTTQPVCTAYWSSSSPVQTEGKQALYNPPDGQTGDCTTVG